MTGCRWTEHFCPSSSIPFACSPTLKSHNSVRGACATPVLRFTPIRAMSVSVVTAISDMTVPRVLSAARPGGFITTRRTPSFARKCPAVLPVTLQRKKPGSWRSARRFALVPAILARNRLCGLRDPGYGPGDSKATLRSSQACLTIQRHWHPRPTVQGTHYGQTKRFLRETFRPRRLSAR